MSQFEILPIWHLDAFSPRVFGGNPAAVVSISGPWPADELLQAIAAETNLSETAFACFDQNPVPLRWFTPLMEVPLCGHATLAAAAVMHRVLGLAPVGSTVEFATASGPLRVHIDNDLLVLDLPARQTTPAAVRASQLEEALGTRIREAWESVDRYVCVLDDASAVQALKPNMPALSALPLPGLIATAPGADCDFVSRYFAPAKGVPEDPVTGTSHCTLAPFWGLRLGKTALRARQLSQRGGELDCTVRGDRVHMAGQCSLYLHGFLALPKVCTAGLR
jgi:PhzF family phenazine biosynthesis protein